MFYLDIFFDSTISGSSHSASLISPLSDSIKCIEKRKLCMFDKKKKNFINGSDYVRFIHDSW